MKTAEGSTEVLPLATIVCNVLFVTILKISSATNPGNAISDAIRANFRVT
jgi:hypothetical protein